VNGFGTVLRGKPGTTVPKWPERLGRPRA